jgi:hypothetical protein
VTAPSPASGRSAITMVAIVILAIIGILAIVAGIMYLTEPAHSLPSVLGTITHPASRAGKHRPARGATALIVGVILLAAAGLLGRFSRPRQGAVAASGPAGGDPAGHDPAVS